MKKDESKEQGKYLFIIREIKKNPKSKNHDIVLNLKPIYNRYFIKLFESFLDLGRSIQPQFLKF